MSIYFEAKYKKCKKIEVEKIFFNISSKKSNVYNVENQYVQNSWRKKSEKEKRGEQKRSKRAFKNV